MNRSNPLSRLTACGFLVAVLILAPLVMPTTGVRARAANALPAGIAEPFAATWLTLNGADLLGSPVSPPVTRDGVLMQFFVYGALVEASDGQISRFAVGAALAQEHHDPERTVAGRRIGSERGMEAFAVDPDHPFAVSHAIADAYAADQGVARYGEPISRTYASGGLRIQWFEYGQLSWTDAEHESVPAFAGWHLARMLDIPVSREIPVSAPVAPSVPADAVTPSRTLSGFAPARITIPAVGIDATVEDIGIVDGVMQTPADVWNVGWYWQLAAPGGSGNAVFAAHRDYWGVGPTVFYTLDQIALGNQIYLTGTDGEEATYTVSAIYTVDADADFSSVISQSDGETITLITCTGSFDGAEYLERLVATGVLNQ